LVASQAATLDRANNTTSSANSPLCNKILAFLIDLLNYSIKVPTSAMPSAQLSATTQAYK